MADLGFATFHLSIPFGDDIQSGFGTSRDFGEGGEKFRAVR